MAGSSESGQNLTVYGRLLMDDLARNKILISYKLHHVNVMNCGFYREKMVTKASWVFKVSQDRRYDNISRFCFQCSCNRYSEQMGIALLEGLGSEKIPQRTFVKFQWSAYISFLNETFKDFSCRRCWLTFAFTVRIKRFRPLCRHQK